MLLFLQTTREFPEELCTIMRGSAPQWQVSSTRNVIKFARAKGQSQQQRRGDIEDTE